jgi:hypothetical protein
VGRYEYFLSFPSLTLPTNHPFQPGRLREGLHRTFVSLSKLSEC